ncbi:hypothetical protein V3851_09575 [Paenibacillus sp. M1]|uniref:Uncharacterized protein n=1 Tax=Paenibacillus haidiansis TaxID=1574488 RepID=A0ABU7VQN0_9BACL
MIQDKAGMITMEEREMMRDYILLTHIHAMVQKSITDLKYTDNILKKTFEMCGRVIEDRVITDMKALRQTLKGNGIVIQNEEHDGFVIRYHFTCRGYQDKFSMTRDVMKAEISIKLGKYVGEIGAAIKSQKTT